VSSFVDSFSEIAKRALYFGVGLASYAGEKAGIKLFELQGQAQQMADEFIKRGETTTEEARQWINTVAPGVIPTPPANSPTEDTRPRQIDILDAEIESEGN
jgi:polyhydroxyalkanoate synthesis regulator phasin